ncbi:PCRF domain-containing protein [Nocardia sp. NPDC059240]|uniref:PCRF domain-containing protein n=1 Tax=Nocardia sp. NPDC059240 TaxID=3346786 RepID=UPI0036AC74E8
MRDAHADLIAAEELAAEDPSFAVEAAELRCRVTEFETRLAELLTRDPHHRDDTVLEVRAPGRAEGSAAMAEALVNLYRGYAESRGWHTEMLTAVPAPAFGYRSATLSISARGGTWPAFAEETGLHRGRWLPFTDPPERPVVADAEVLAYPESSWWERFWPDDSEVVFHQYNYGPLPLARRMPDVLLTHLPTGVEAYTAPTYGRTANVKRAQKLLVARLTAVAEGRAEPTYFARVPSRGPTDHIRTYNLIANELTDHRLDLVLSAPFDPDNLTLLAEALRAPVPGSEPPE